MRIVLLALLLFLPLSGWGRERPDGENGCAGGFRALVVPPRADPNTNLLFNLLRVLTENLERPQVADTAFRGNPMAEKLLALAKNGQLLNQNDARLGAMGLHVPRGGLCASTDMVNLLCAMVLGPGGDTQRVAPLMVDAVLNMYKDVKVGQTSRKLTEQIYFGDAYSLGKALEDLGNAFAENRFDGRHGAYVNDLLEAVRPVVNAVGGGISNPLPATVDHMTGSSLANGLMVATGRITDSGLNSAEVHGIHALLIPKLDPVNRLIYVCDPNRPNAIYARPYWLTPAGQVQFESLVSYVPAGPSYITLDQYQLVQQVGESPSIPELVGRLEAMKRAVR